MNTTTQLFYHNYDDDEGIPSDAPITVTKEQAIEYMENLPPGDGNFLGLVMPSGQAVQFMYDEDENILLDIPVPGGSKSKQLDSFEESIEIIEYVFDGKDPLQIEDLEFDSYE